jgi:very-short-patch-repair endonuclease/predicted transcriptional regulator of viral defense system
VLDLLDDIRSQTRGRPVDAAVAALADRQHGVVARRQLAALGMGPGSIQHRLGSARLHRVFRAVYSVGHSRLTQRGRWMAAVLSCGEDALLSHRSAAALWGIAPYQGRWIDVIAPGSRRGRRSPIAVHGGALLAKDGTLRDGIPVTSVARTILDLAEVVDRRRLERAVEQAERMEVLDLRALECMAMRHGRRALKPLRAVLAELRPSPETRSELERRFVAFCRKADLPTPGINRIVLGFEVDALWHSERLVVELDSYSFHRSRRAFELDRQRDAALAIAGYRVLRITDRRLREDPSAVADTIRALLTPVFEVFNEMRSEPR